MNSDDSHFEHKKHANANIILFFCTVSGVRTLFPTILLESESKYCYEKYVLYLYENIRRQK